MNDVDTMAIDELPILDSFVKESMRTTCFDACHYSFKVLTFTRVFKGSLATNNSTEIKVSYRRVALEDYKFFDGHRVAKGDLVAIPQSQILNNEIDFPDPARFDGLRFASMSRADAWKSTHHHQNWPFWGSQKQLW